MPNNARPEKLGMGFLCLAALSVLLLQPVIAGTKVEEGIAEYKAGNYMKARVLFEQAVAARASDYRAHYYLGNCYLALGQFASAQRAYETALNANPDPGFAASCRAGIEQAQKYASGSRRTTNSSSSNSGRSSAPSPGNALVEQKRRVVMERARAECEKIRREMAEQKTEEKSNSQELFRYADGSVGTDISREREREIEHEADERCKKIMENAERAARSIY